MKMLLRCIIIVFFFTLLIFLGHKNINNAIKRDKRNYVINNIIISKLKAFMWAFEFSDI